jgi:hypothetical protein
MIEKNTSGYYNNLFKGSFLDKLRRTQTQEFAKAFLPYLKLENKFNGKITDFGCAFGDAIPIYKSHFPNAGLTAIDISSDAINKCKSKYGKLATFICGTDIDVPETEIIITSHVMEHIVGDKVIIKNLLTKCDELYIIVPFRENPLYREHVNSYDYGYYSEFNVVREEAYAVNYKSPLYFRAIIKSFIKLKPKYFFVYNSKNIIYHLKGNKL